MRDKDNQRRNMITGRPNTIRTQVSLCKNWIVPHLKTDGSNLDAVIQVWENDLEPNTIKSLLYISKKWVKNVTNTNINIQPHIARISRSKQQLPVQALSTKEIVALTAMCKAKAPKLYVPLMIALHTGMRRGEVFGLTWDDVDMLRSRISINKSYKGPTKNGKSRIVPISSALEKVLLAIIPMKSYNKTEAIIPRVFDPNPLLRRVCKLAGIREITFHTLRHTWATLALESGRSPKLVSQNLGHSQVSTTINLYWASTQQIIDLGFLPDA